MDDPRGDVLIILGGSLLDRELIGMNSYWRAIYATRAWHESAFRHVIIAGGGPEKETIAEPMKRFLTCYGVPGDIIELETRSNNTWENALRTKELLTRISSDSTKRPRLVLLTSDYHMYRAVRVFRKVGLDVQPRPFPDVAKRSYCMLCRWDAFQDVVLETTKIGYYALRGRL